MDADHAHAHGSAHDGSDGSSDVSALLEHASLWKVIATGLGLGVVHVLTGPDHLSALVALSSGQSWTHSLALGAQWGCGHSLGILLIAGVCLLLGHALTFGQFIHDLLNYIVGVFLIAIGAWTLYHARIEYDLAMRPPSKWDSVQCQDATYTLISADESDAKQNAAAAFFTSHSTGAVERFQRSTSVCVGIVHGVAGPGGVLGVLPVVAMHKSLSHAVTYLGCFCLSSIVCMAVFASIYGEVTRRSGAQSAVIAFRVACVSSCVSILVGIAWVVLQACGGLDSVFGHHH